jgi:hypothetical protein
MLLLANAQAAEFSNTSALISSAPLVRQLLVFQDQTLHLSYQALANYLFAVFATSKLCKRNMQLPL